MYLDAPIHTHVCVRVTCGVRFTGFGTISYMAVTGLVEVLLLTCNARKLLENRTRDQRHVNSSCAAFFFSPSSFRLAFSAILSSLPFSHYWRLTDTLGLASRYGLPSLGFLRPRWQLVVSISTGASSAVAPLVGTYAQALFVALFRDTPVARTRNGAERSWCPSKGDTLFVLAFGSHLFLVPCLV